MDEVKDEKNLTAAERYYQNLKRAQANYWKRKHPNPKPVGRPKKLKITIPPPEMEEDEVNVV